MADFTVSKLECLRNNQTYTEVKKNIRFYILGKMDMICERKKNI